MLRHPRQRKKRTILWLLGGLLLVAAPAGAQQAPRPRDPERPWVAAADSLFATGDVEGAVQRYRELTAGHAQDVGLWLRLAAANLRLRRPGPALEAARTARDLDPDEPDVYLLLAQCQAAAGESQRGLTTLEEGLRRFPENRELLEGVTTVYLGMERWAEAAGLLRELIRLDPQRIAYRIDLGRLHLNAGQHEEALQVFREAGEIGADEALIGALVGKALLLGGRVDPARAEFEASIARRPNAEALGGLGAIHFLREEFAQAAERFRQALELDPDDADLYFNLGNVLTRQGQVEGATQAYRESLRRDPFSAETHANLGVLLLTRFRVADARQHLQEAIRLDPGLRSPYLHLGRIAAAAYQYERALEYYGKYRERVGDEAEQRRIDGVLERLRTERQASADALASGQVHLFQLRVPTREKAEQLRRRVREGEDFFVLAQQESDMAELAGVDAGFLDPAGLNPSFREAIGALKRGQTTPPLEGPNGWYLFHRAE